MKKFSFLVIPFILLLGLFTAPVNAEVSDDVEKYEDEFSDLSQKEVNEKFEEINEKYDIEEEFSKRDQAFVKMYAEPINDESNNIKPMATESVSESKTKNGVTVKVNGTLDINNQGVINQSFGANLKTRTTKGASKVNSVKTEVEHNAYGIIGSGGIGKTYTGKLTNSGKNNDIDSSKNYQANAAYAVSTVTVTVNHGANKQFTVNYP